MIKTIKFVLLFSIFTGCSMLVKVSATSLVVESFNIRYDNPDDAINAWPNRQQLIYAHLKTLQPDVLGLQEVLHHQLSWLNEQLPDYSYIGVGRDDGVIAGEFVPLFYNKNTITKLDGGNFWLSETPDVAGSIGWQAQLPRVASWGHFEKDGSDFFVFNVHFSHVSDLARQKSAEFLLTHIPAIAGNKPVILLGDFNMLNNSAAYKALTSSRLLPLTDTATVANAEDVGTYNGFTAGDSSRIDYIFISNGLKSHDYRTYQLGVAGVYISDHFPISTVITLPQKP
ncbi:Metal-dependent hydrolase, endonuclease/exonuclease/phosphatase family [Rheinheimera pacifica]|uniref:Metal-dependent hydrolase, endonuclease/exonuclease/phosphatase family n=1 Tax=Rheinheimera pacifica TaxID=173990 RepID=A0A1H6JMF0_9GAMM|nr:endonuclease/exonuclease/phosphatase family protein [Rheinheimera pacifica]SEH63531.1 Metal-dependent hydrolase, endonuclease/exonuclease/phosphatase family [Rheinheimera pacifica]